MPASIRFGMELYQSIIAFPKRLVNLKRYPCRCFSVSLKPVQNTEKQFILWIKRYISAMINYDKTPSLTF